jgi:hypothetical protein
MPTLKPIDIRTTEVIPATKKLFELGITKTTYPELDRFFQDLNMFIRGCDYSISGRVNLDGLNRTLAYNLCASSNISSTIVLLSNKESNSKSWM